MLLESMREKSLISRRIFKDCLVSQNSKPNQVEITQEMIKAVGITSTLLNLFRGKQKIGRERERE